MSQSLMPEIDRGSGGMKSLWRRWLQRIEIAGAITSELHLAGVKILYGKTIGIEFQRHSIVTG
jgi:hypothetical protein